MTDKTSRRTTMLKVVRARRQPSPSDGARILPAGPQKRMRKSSDSSTLRASRTSNEQTSSTQRSLAMLQEALMQSASVTECCVVVRGQAAAWTRRSQSRKADDAMERAVLEVARQLQLERVVSCNNAYCGIHP
jgi:hypothetical protein